MKKILFILLLISGVAVAQTPQTSYQVTSIATMKTYYGAANRIHVIATNQDYVQCSPCTTDEIYIFAGAGGRKWKKVSDSLKVNVFDTASMLSPYLRINTAAATYQPIGSYLTGGDTASLSNRINLRVKISDTASMLSPYLRSVIAAATYQPIGSYLTSVDTTNIANFSTKVRSLFSVTAPITYNSATGAIAITAMNASTAGYVAAGGSANKILHGDGTWKDTTASGSGTVTSVATGLGLSGGTITTTGTLLVDTASASILSRQRAALTYAPISGGTYVSSTGTTGDIASWSATNTPSRISAVATGSLFASAGTGTLPVWSASPSLTTSLTVPLINGGTAANDDITIQGTSNATRTTSYVNLQPSGGNVGIGTIAPTGLIHAVGVAPAIRFESNSTGNDNAAAFQGQFSRGTNAAKTIVVNGDNLFSVVGYGYDGSSYQASGRFGIDVDGTPSGGAMPGRITFGTNPSGSANIIERWRISSTGTLSNTGSTGTAYLHIKANTASASTGAIKLTAGVVLTTPESGVLETDASNDLYYTNSGAVRARVALRGYTAKSANYTATNSDYTLDATANTFTFTLPTAVGIAGRSYYITNSGAGIITVATTSSQTFTNVATAPTTLTIAAAVGTVPAAVEVQSNGANWLQLK